MPLATEYPFLDIVWTMLVFFGFVIWIRLLFTMLGDVFRRDDLSGGGKFGWTLFAIVVPLLGVLIYLGRHGKEIAERNAAEARAAQKHFDDYVRDAAGSGGPATEIAKAKELLDSGAITQSEYEQAKQKALASA